jgi:hypothetical protein
VVVSAYWIRTLTLAGHFDYVICLKDKNTSEDEKRGARTHSP